MDNNIPDFENRWEEYKQKLKQNYPHLTEADLQYELNKEEELLERLQIKLGKTKKEIFDWLHLMG